MTISLGPYEPRGPYGVLAESERFDTSGISARFCPGCEHEPCVAGLRNTCAHPPRFNAAFVLGRRIDEAIHPLYETNYPVWTALTVAHIELVPLACNRDFVGNSSLRALARMAEALEQKPGATA